MNQESGFPFFSTFNYSKNIHKTVTPPITVPPMSSSLFRIKYGSKEMNTVPKSNAVIPRWGYSSYPSTRTYGRAVQL